MHVTLKNIFCPAPAFVMLLLSLSGCGDGEVSVTESFCGNDVRESGEACDGADLGHQTCETLGHPAGALKCLSTCLFDVSACTPAESCGNRKTDPGEECDGADLGGETCQSQGFAGGDLKCDGDCTLDTSACTSEDLCGNQQKDPGEQCDGGDLGNETCESRGLPSGELKCSSGCTFDTSACGAAVTWSPANIVHIQSGGSSNLLKSPTAKMAIRYVASSSKNVTEISLLPCCYFPTAVTVWRVGLQADTAGVPEGNYLGSQTFSNVSDENWFTVSISPAVQLSADQVYWIVLQYESGPTPSDSENFLGVYASSPAEDLAFDDIPLPNNDSGDKSTNDRGTTTVRFHDGNGWQLDPNGRNLAVFMLTFDDGSHHGQPYRHNYVDLGDGAQQAAQVFVNRASDKTVNRLEMPLNSYGQPTDNLYYFIKEDDWNGRLLANGVFITPAQIVGEGTGSRRWYGVDIEPPITFGKDRTYFLYFNSPNTHAPDYWGSDAANSFGSFEEVTYGGTESFFRRTESDWSDYRVYSGRDLSFRFRVVASGDNPPPAPATPTPAR